MRKPWVKQVWALWTLPQYKYTLEREQIGVAKFGANKLAKLRRHASRVHFASNSFGPIHFVLELCDLQVSRNVSHHVGHHNVVSMLCEGSKTLTEWKFETITYLTYGLTWVGARDTCMSKKLGWKICGGNFGQYWESEGMTYQRCLRIWKWWLWRLLRAMIATLKYLLWSTLEI